jgi:hypothetical protein
MSIEYLLHKAAQRKAAAAVAEAVARGESPPLPPEFQPFLTEITTFYHELPRLLGEGEGGRFVVLRGDKVDSIWDTGRDARQHGYRTFDDGRFLTAEIDSEFLAVFSPHFQTHAQESA